MDASDHAAEPVPLSVGAPPALRELFLKAQEYVSQYYAARDEDPRRGTISISGERYILVRAASMSVEFFDLVSSLYEDAGREQAQGVAGNLLFDVAHALGKADARAFHTKMGVTQPLEKLSAGPIHFSFAGWAFVHLLPGCNPVPSDEFLLLFEHPFSFESDAWIRQGRRSDKPVCIMNAGYASGWCEESFGLSLVAVETMCQARGDECCRFIMAPPGRIEEHLARHVGTPRQLSFELTVPEFFQRKRLEDALRRSHGALEQRVAERTRELAEANRALESEMARRKQEEDRREKLEAQVRHKQKLESLGVLAGGIAHDFNNLLVGILGGAGLALMQLPPDSPARRTLENLELAAQRAADLTRQLLAYSGRGTFLIERLDLSQLVNETSELLSSLVSAKTRVVKQLTSELPRVEGDATELRQVVMNLITNAAEALEGKGGSVWLRTGTCQVDDPTLEAYASEESSPGAHVYLEVEDDGSGMSEEARAKLFDPFFTTKFTGRGLGLAAVLGIVRGHRGIIRLRSEPGRGTCFRVLFPVAQTSVEYASEKESSAPPLAPGERATVLVVDDEALVRQLASATLQTAGFEVLCADGGAEALALYQRHRGDIDVVLLDLTMPAMSGDEVFAALRALDPEVRIVLSSGYSEQEAVKHFSGRGPCGFVAKPYKAKQLIARIRAALQLG